MEILGAKLKNKRKELKMTQAEIAKHLNVNRVTYTGWEKGLHEPKLTDLINLANLFQTSTDYLLGRYDNNRQEKRQ